MHKQINGPSPVAITTHVQYKNDIYTYDARYANKAHTQFYRIGTVANSFVNRGPVF